MPRRTHRGAPVLELDPFDDAFLTDPYPGYALLREAGPVVWLERYQVWAMARFGEVNASLRDWETFCSSRGVGLADFSKEDPWRPPSLLLETDPPLHDRMRAILNPIVSMAALNAYRPAWREVADQLVRALVARRAFDAVTELTEPFPLKVFPDAIGMPAACRDRLLEYASLAFNAFGPRNARSNQALEAAAPLMGWVAETCKRAALSPEGFGAQIFEAVDRGEISEGDAERLVRSFLTAGVDTTINGLAGMIYAFATHPEQWDLVRRDRSLVRGAFEEAVRWASPVQTFFRTTTREVEVAGITLPEGEKVLLFLAAANRDPERWASADQFDVRRRAGGHVGFGVGIHACLGQVVARVESEIVLNSLLDHVERLELTAPAELRLNNTLRSFAHMPVRVQPALIA